MTQFSNYCDAKLRTCHSEGIKELDRIIVKEMNGAIRNGYEKGKEELVENVISELDITDDAMAEVASARVTLVIARIFGRMNKPEWRYAVRCFDEDIPCYTEALEHYKELNK